MAEILPGRTISEDDQKRAKLFFDKARTIAETGNYEYGIELYLQGLNFDPEAVDMHIAIREIALIRKANGGKPMGMFDKAKLRKGDDKQNMLNAEKLLAYDPSNTEHMEAFMVAAQKAGCYDTVAWIGNICLSANNSLKQPSFQRYIKIKNVFKSVGQFTAALNAMQYAVRMKPSDMDLAHEMKNLAAEETIKKAKYDTGGSFTESVRDKDAQRKLLEQDMDVRTEDQLVRNVRDLQVAYEEDPNDISKFSRYVEALKKTEMLEYENVALEILDKRYRDTKQYRFRQSANQITIAQLGRQERALREEVQKSPNDPDVKKEYMTFLREKTEQELRIFRETVENYPTDSAARFEMGRRLFALNRHDEAIPVFQQVRMDPKYRGQASTLLGRAFLQAGFVDEAVDTLLESIQQYPVRGDEKSIEMHYYYGLALEQKGDIPVAVKTYSQVAQWNFTYRDVQQRIKRLRAAPQ